MSRPTPGTPEWYLWLAAIEVATYPPLDHNDATTYAAKVPWSRVQKLRAALDELGIDWRKVKTAGGPSTNATVRAAYEAKPAEVDQ